MAFKALAQLFSELRNMNTLTPSKSLTGQVVVITGASSGAGKAAAVAFAEAGAHVVLGARREEALAETARMCEAQGVKAVPVITDVTDATAVKRLADAALQVTGRIDVWVNNAGVLAVGALDEMPIETADGVIKTNLLGYLHGAHAVLPHFKRQRKGVLINNISIGGWVPAPYGVAYSASKFGLRGMVEALQSEISNYPDIYVCAMYPAFLDTPGIQHAANHLGVQIKAAPPVFDPQNVAKAMVNLALKPKNSSWPDWGGPLYRIGYALAPRLARKLAAKGLGAYRKAAKPAPPTDGNVFDNATPITSVHGGWCGPQDAAVHNAGIVAIGAAAALLFMKLRRS